MKRSCLFLLVLAAIVATSIGVISATAGTSSKAAEAAPPAAPQATNGSPSADLRVTLDRLLGEHAVLAQNATNSGVTGRRASPPPPRASTATPLSSQRRSHRSTARMPETSS